MRNAVSNTSSRGETKTSALEPPLRPVAAVMASALLLALPAVSSAQDDLQVTCTTTGIGANDRPIRTTATTELAQHFTVDVFGGRSPVENPGVSTLVATESTRRNRRSNSLSIGETFFNSPVRIAPNVVLAPASPTASGLNTPVVRIAIGQSEATDAILDRASDRRARRLRNALRSRRVDSAAVFDYDELARAPQSERLTFAEVFRGRVVTVPVTLTCSR